MVLYDLSSFPDNALIAAYKAIEMLKDIGFEVRDLFEVEEQLKAEGWRNIGVTT